MSPSDRERSLPASRLVRRRSGRDALHDPKVEAHTSTGRNECAHARLASGFARSFGGGLRRSREAPRTSWPAGG